MKTPIFLLVIFLSANLNAGVIRHEMKVKIDPARNLLEAEDTITLPEHADRTTFTLYKGLSPAVLTEGAELKEISSPKDGAGFARYSLLLPRSVKTFEIKYSGVINYQSADPAGIDAASGAKAPALITADGAYLSGAAFWHPGFDGSLATYKIETDLPEGYDSVTSGEQVSRKVSDARTLTVWKIANPQEEITLICGRFKEYKASANRLDYQVFLREADDMLAQRYLDAAIRYIEMYSDLIEPYPYKRFSVVENFWEASAGVPAVTLLGPKAIRLPFIASASFQHETLRNWWGNSVFAGYANGNWSEGLTTYLADYLLSEGRGKGREYRMAALQKYADYARSAKDLPLRDFRAGDLPAAEAMNAKSLMFYHMLRTSLGDEKFKTALRDFYKKNKFRRASYDDLKLSFEGHTDHARLDTFFEQWVNRSGAPELALKNVRTLRELDGNFSIEFTITQVQDGPAYQLEVPVAVHLENISQPRLMRLVMNKKEEIFKYSATVRPARVEIDPEFDLFRTVSPLETSPTLARLLEAEKPLIILPSAAPEETVKAYAAFAATLTGANGKQPEIKSDSELAALPGDRQLWVFGAENKFYPVLAARLEKLGAKFTSGQAILNNQRFPPASSTFVLADFNPENPLYSAGLILAGRPGKLQLLTDKLPYYGEYGCLVFDDDMIPLGGANWEVKSSPLIAVMSPGAPRHPYPERVPLATPASIFKEELMAAHVLDLVSDLEGRGPGEAGVKYAYKYIGRMFIEYGLTNFFTKGGLAQGWKESGQIYRNLAGLVEGTSRKDEYVLISAHYDHLPSKNGRIYPGANDNASGVALMLELASYYSKHRPERSIIFAAFTGEEEGRRGSRYFLKSLPEGMTEKINADINLDSVGRLTGGKILVLNSDSSEKWSAILRNAGFVTNTRYETPKQNMDLSDQISFIEAGVPAIQIFNGANADYHKTTDTADKIDYKGMVKEAEFVKELVDSLADSGDLLPRRSMGQTPGAPAEKQYNGLIP